LPSPSCLHVLKIAAAKDKIPENGRSDGDGIRDAASLAILCFAPLTLEERDPWRYFVFF